MNHRTPSPHKAWIPTLLRWSGAALTGLLYGVALLGGNTWPFALVAFVPLWLALDRATPRQALGLGLGAGFVGNVVVFAWVFPLLSVFGEFSKPLCLLLSALLCLLQGGGRMACMSWLHSRAKIRGWPLPFVAAGAFVASELLWPTLFPWYFGASAHAAPLLLQTAELGGPILVGLVLLGVNLCVLEPLLAHLDHRPVHRPFLFGMGAGLACVLLWSGLRIRTIDARVAEAPSVKVGLVQANLGLFEKRYETEEGLARHQQLTQELKAQGIELVVWSESSAMNLMPVEGLAPVVKAEVGAQAGVPLLFGGMLYSLETDPPTLLNSALATNEQGELTGRYDKHILMPFGETIPFGESFPVLYRLLPNSYRFLPGTQTGSISVEVHGTTHPVTLSICYEDLFPTLTRQLIQRGPSDMLVNLTNDAWYGDTSEPWQHLALAKLRAVEHRRYLLRGTNSGVSAIVDPVGRVVAHSELFQPQTVMGTAHWMSTNTVYARIGDTLWYVWTFLIGVTAWLPFAAWAGDKPQSHRNRCLL